MTYSVLYHIEGDEDEWAVDWDWHERGRWARSFRENGLGHKWEYIGGMDERAYRALINHFRLEGREREFPLGKIVKMSPARLAEISNTNPESHTLGDHRRALEVA